MTANMENRMQILDSFLAFLPTMGLPADSSYSRRIAKAFGIRPDNFKHLLDQVRDSCPAVFKAATKELEATGMPRDTPRATRNAELAVMIFGSVHYRSQLFERYLELCAAGHRTNTMPPILEFQLIKAWDDDYDVTRKNVPGYELFENIPGVTWREMDLQPSFTAALLSDVPLHSMRAKLTQVADRVLVNLTACEAMADEELALSACAVFAVASLARKPTVLMAFCTLVPALTPFIAPPSANTETNKLLMQTLLRTDLDGAAPLRQQLQLHSLLAMSCLSCFKAEPELEILSTVRKIVEIIERLYLDLGMHDAQRICTLSQEIRDILVRVQEDFAAAGAPLEIQPMFDRIAVWDELLNHDIMQRPSDARSTLTRELLDEADTLRQHAASLQASFERIACQREEAMAPGLNWTTQADMLQVIAQNLKAAQDKARSEAESVAHLPEYLLEPVEPPAPAPVEEPVPVQPCPEKWAAEMTQLEHYWKDQLKEANGRIDSLRQDNATLKTQMDALKHGMAKPTPAAPVVPEELVSHAESMAASGNTHDVLRLMQLLYPERLVILPSAFESSKALSNVPVPKLLAVLKAMATVGLDQVRSSGQIIDCEDLVPCGISVNESDSVRNNAKFRKQRAFRYNNQQHHFYPHLRLGYGLRIYFDYFPEEQRFVVAYVGNHMGGDKNPTA